MKFLELCLSLRLTARSSAEVQIQFLLDRQGLNRTTVVNTIKISVTEQLRRLTFTRRERLIGIQHENAANKPRKWISSRRNVIIILTGHRPFEQFILPARVELQQSFTRRN